MDVQMLCAKPAWRRPVGAKHLRGEPVEAAAEVAAGPRESTPLDEAAA